MENSERTSIREDVIAYDIKAIHGGFVYQGWVQWLTKHLSLYRFNQVIKIFFVQEITGRHEITPVLGHCALINERDVCFVQVDHASFLKTASYSVKSSLTICSSRFRLVCCSASLISLISCATKSGS